MRYGVCTSNRSRMPANERSEHPQWALLIGGSAGSLAPLQHILSHLHADGSYAVFVVVHTMPDRAGHLASVLARTSALPIVVLGSAPAPIREGTVYVASPDRHLKVTTAGVQLTREVREHHTRPAIDVLFRSGARVFGPRTIAVLLSGYGGDGITGSAAIAARGGTVIVQSPAEADVPSMPQRAITTGHVDQVAPVAEIPAIIRALMNGGAQSGGRSAMEGPEDKTRQIIAADIREQEENGRTGQTATVVCPDCGGVLWQHQQGQFVDFSCHIGHRFASDALLVHKTEHLEAALLTAFRLLREKAMLLHQTAKRARDNGHHRAADRMAEQAAVDENYALLIQRELLEAERSPLSTATVDEAVAALEEDRPES